MEKGILILKIDWHAPNIIFGNKPDISHVTLLYGTAMDNWKQILGKRVTIEIVKIAWNQEIQVALVKLPEAVSGLCQNAFPHITMSWADGAFPSEASALFADPFRAEIQHHEVLESVVDFKSFKK